MDRHGSSWIVMDQHAPLPRVWGREHAQTTSQRILVGKKARAGKDPPLGSRPGPLNLCLRAIQLEYTVFGWP